jgi:hypothetical protein
MPDTETPWSMIEGAVDAAKDKIHAAMEVVGDEMLHELKVEVSTPCPNYPKNKRLPHSPPYGYPYEESGEFRGNLYTTVIERGPSVVLQLWSKTRRNHGKFLNEGTVKMKPRPYGELILVKKNWIARIAEVARTMNRQE